jgi:hypothetical protein
MTTHPKKRIVRTPVDGVNIHSDGETIYWELEKYDAVLHLSREESVRMASRLRHLGYRTQSSEAHEVIDSIWTSSEGDKVSLWIEGTPVSLTFTRHEAGILGGQFFYQSHFGREPKEEPEPFEEIDDILLMQIMADKRRPFEGIIPRGHKVEYIKELHAAGWSYNEIMVRTKASGRTIKNTLRPQEVQS